MEAQTKESLRSALVCQGWGPVLTSLTSNLGSPLGGQSLMLRLYRWLRICCLAIGSHQTYCHPSRSKVGYPVWSSVQIWPWLPAFQLLPWGINSPPLVGTCVFLNLNTCFLLTFWPSLILSFCLHPTSQVSITGACIAMSVTWTESLQRMGWGPGPFPSGSSFLYFISPPNNLQGQWIIAVSGGNPTSWDFVAWIQVWVS